MKRKLKIKIKKLEQNGVLRIFFKTPKGFLYHVSPLGKKNQLLNSKKKNKLNC